MALEDLLSGVPLFSKLSRRDVARLIKSGHEVTYPAGKSLAAEGELGVTFFVIAEGEARVEVKGKEVKRMGPGDYFGEMALIDLLPRAATVTTETEMTCFVMSAWHFRPFVAEHPDVAWALLEAMVKRIREIGS